jgi:hypothetical protein
MSGRPEGLHFCVDQDGWTGAHQFSVDDAAGGYRLSGPKYNGSSKRILTYVPSDRDLGEIAQYVANEQRRRAAIAKAEAGQ